MVIELHFFHGFLGNPSDWAPIIEGLEIPDPLRVVVHDLFSDYQDLQGERGMKDWAQKHTASVSDSNVKKVMVGYSMGGRLLMHLDPARYHGFLLLSAQPGLTESVEQRLQWEEQLARKAEAQSVEQWLQHWNNLPLFQNDRVRPTRNLSKKVLQQKVQMLRDWSVAKQGQRDTFFKENGSKVFWACGNDDEKYSEWFGKIKNWLPAGHATKIANAGHGVIFDQPTFVAKWIGDSVGNLA